MKRTLLLCFALISFLMVDAAPKKKPAAPDFAFPKTVEADASAALSKQISGKQYPQALASAMQIVVARNLVNNSDVDASVAFLDSIGRLIPQPYSAIATLLQAQVYLDYYQGQAYKFDQRTLPLNSFPPECAEWSKGLFAKKIGLLVEKAVKETSEAPTVPLSDLAPILTSVKGARYIPDAYSLTVCKAIDMLGTFAPSANAVIPFSVNGKTDAADSPYQHDKKLQDKITDSYLEYCARHDSQPALAFAMLLKASRMEGKSTDYLWNCLQKTSGTPESLMILDRLSQYYTGIGNAKTWEGTDSPARRWLEAARRATAEFPTADFCDNVKNEIGEMCSEQVSLQFKSQALSTEPVNVSVASVNAAEPWVLLMSVPFESVRMSNLKKILSSARLVKALKSDITGTVPFQGKDSLSFGKLPYGYYIVVPSKNNTKAGIPADLSRESATFFCVSDLTFLSTSAYKDNSVYIADAITGRPVQGVKVEFRSDRNNSEKIVSSKVTDTNGRVTAPEGSYRIVIAKGSDRLRNYAYFWNRGKYNPVSSEDIALFTDLSIYHPGDTVQFAAIAYQRSAENAFSLLKNREISVNLINANWEDIDSVRLTTDEYGRISSSFRLPTDGLLGNFRLRAKSGDKASGISTFEVADYKAPTFYAEIDSITVPGNDLGNITIHGKAQTYNGMPVADAQVKFDIRYVSYWCWRGTGAPDATFAAETTSDAQGNFSISLSVAGLKETPYRWGAYQLNTSVTSPAGETQTAPSKTFALGSAWKISPDIPAAILADKNKKDETFSVTVNDMLGIPEKKTVEFTVIGSDGPVKTGTFVSPEFNIQTSDLKSGRYTIHFNVEGADSASIAEATTIIYRKSDKLPPVETALWVPEKNIVAAADSRNVDVAAGNSYSDGWILCVTSTPEGIVSSRWIKGGEISKIKVQAPAEGSTTWVNLWSVRDLEPQNAIVTVEPASFNDNLKIETVTFRDKITSGDRESWKFRFIENGKTAPFTPAIAVLSDKALNAIEPFTWSFVPRNRYTYNPLSLTSSRVNSITESFPFSTYKYLQGTSIEYPDWQTYGYSLCSSFYTRAYGAYLMDSCSPQMATATTKKMRFRSAEALEESADNVVNEATVEIKSAAGATADGEQKAQPEQLRKIEHPLAWFKPQLVADKDGVVSLDFIVPDFNTTWQLQMIGYTDRLLTSSVKLDAVSSKPVMIQTRLPRFLRIGDRATISATVMNASDGVIHPQAEIEIFDAITGRRIAAKSFSGLTLEPKQSKAVEIEFNVPADVSSLGVKSTVIAGNHSDGEQDAVPVLEASSPVTESKAFYIPAKEDSFSVKLPSYGKDDTVTLQYCDNPVWYCVTALSPIATAKSKSLLDNLRAYYSNAIAKGLTTRYPAIAKGIEALSSDSLTSPLAQNAELKILALGSTPWTGDAAAETIRLQQLNTLLHPAASAQESILKHIASLQNPDGGWSWCPGMPSSAWITGQALFNFGRLRMLGYDSANTAISAMITKGLKYYDHETYSQFELNKMKMSPVSAVNWLFIRTLFDEKSNQPGYAKMHAYAVSQVRSGWKRFAIAEKAKAAVVLNRLGYSMQAREILESLRQNAVVSPELGMRYENLASGYNGYSRLFTTALALSAFAEITPEAPAVDQLRQGLIIQRETEDWGQNAYTVDVVQTILESGASWTALSPDFTISLGDMTFTPDEKTSPLGYFKTRIAPHNASGKTLLIERKGTGPAWGSIMAQRIQPILDVKNYRMPEIAITKAVYRIVDRPGETVEKATDFAPGEKVRVTLTLTASRDMEYVAITDGRSACLEPVEQLSGYVHDSLGYYREVRDASTNIFISFLPKGTHTITYDCYVTGPGEYSLGIATAQCQYAPQLTAHSAGTVLKIK